MKKETGSDIRRNPYNREYQNRSGYAGNTIERNGQLRREVPKNTRAKEESGFKKWLSRWFIKTGTLDATFLILVLILLCIGSIMMFSASYTSSYYKHGGDALWFFKRQIIFAAVGIAGMLFVSRINYQKLNSGLAILGYGLSVMLLIVTFIVNLLNPNKDSDFKRWLDLGFIKFQPSEIAKFGLILFLAYNIARQYGMIQSKRLPQTPFLRGVDDVFTSKIRASFYKNASTTSMALTIWYALIITLICGLVIIENHLSGTILVFLLGICMMWLGGVKKGYFIILAILVAVVVVVVIKKPDILPDYAEQRIVAWLDKDYDPLGARWQTNQSIRAIASGGPFGLGLGNSRQKHMYVSEPQNDFIFAIVCEELGFVGAAAIIGLFVALVWRAFKIAGKARDVFGSVLAMGIALQVGIQVFLNIAVVTDTFPNTGISLPFFSYGGSSLIMLLCEMGIILSVSRKSSILKT